MFARSTRNIAAHLRRPSYPRQIVQSRSIQQQLPTARLASTTPEPKPQGSLNHKTFYKTFGRPIAKVFLLAIFTYQLVYYFWVRLEHAEIHAEMQGAAFPFLPPLPPPKPRSSPAIVADAYVAMITDLEERIGKLEQAKEPQQKKKK
ncbi:hypothetical protein GGS21DRAFT_486196 [Xylaria nigripes]|nr:hypothetical protein GGS21DRAFT_486196 [Xylaria nigripes]